MNYTKLIKLANKFYHRIKLAEWTNTLHIEYFDDRTIKELTVRDGTRIIEKLSFYENPKDAARWILRRQIADLLDYKTYISLPRELSMQIEIFLLKKMLNHNSLKIGKITESGGGTKLTKGFSVETVDKDNFEHDLDVDIKKMSAEQLEDKIEEFIKDPDNYQPFFAKSGPADLDDLINTDDEVDVLLDRFKTPRGIFSLNFGQFVLEGKVLHGYVSTAILDRASSIYVSIASKHPILSKMPYYFRYDGNQRYIPAATLSQDEFKQILKWFIGQFGYPQ